MNCLARVAVTYDGEYEETGPFHNHNGELTLINEYRFVNACKERAANTCAPFRALYNEIAQRLFIKLNVNLDIYLNPF